VPFLSWEDKVSCHCHHPHSPLFFFFLNSYEIYKWATNLAELSKLGATPADLRHDLARGYLTLIDHPFTLPPTSSNSISSKKSAASKNSAGAPAIGGKRGAVDATKSTKKSASSSSVSWAKSKELRRERNERRAKLREGEVRKTIPFCLHAAELDCKFLFLYRHEPGREHRSIVSLSHLLMPHSLPAPRVCL